MMRSCRPPGWWRRAATRDESAVIEDALRRYVGLDVVEDVWRRSDLSHDQALALADTEKHAPRASKRGLAGTRGAR